jgi:peptidoglycan/xylan/chitin deacetylase (PgdA/CDA1 family)
MNLSVSAKSVLAKVSGLCGIPEIAIRNRAGKRYLILMYHRVMIPGRQAFPVQAGMYVEPKTFEEHVRYLQRRFHVIPFSGIFPPDPARETSQSDRPACILTFDDGWRDFHEFAYPVLERYGVPATVFLPTRYIGTNEWFWTDRLAVLMKDELPSRKRDPHGTGPGADALDRIASLTGGFENRLEAAIGMLKDMREKEIEGVIAVLLKERSRAVPFPGGRAFLNWEEIREMKESGLVSFGSHTHSHRILTLLEEEEIREELALSREILLRERAVEPSFIPFCYPNGNSNDRVVRMVQEAGYHASVSTGTGWNREGSSPFDLKRIPIHQDMAGSREMFGCRIAEIL